MLAGEQRRRGEVELGLPRGVAAQSVEDLAPNPGWEEEERPSPFGCNGHPLPPAITAAGCHRRHLLTSSDRLAGGHRNTIA